MNFGECTTTAWVRKTSEWTGMQRTPMGNIDTEIACQVNAVGLAGVQAPGTAAAVSSAARDTSNWKDYGV